jgi:hypothetical protein
VISIATDMALPQQVDEINVQVQVRGRSYFDYPYMVGPSVTDNRVPGTITLVSGDDPSLPVTVRVGGKKNGEWRTFREITTTVPADRTALLRMPVQWLCNDTVQTVSTPDGAGGVVTRTLSKCEGENTCMAGKCVPNLIDSKDLPDYTRAAVFGGADDPKQGKCFDTLPCMIKGRVATPDAECTVAKPEGDAVNVALRVTNDGICDSSGTVCFVPLDAQSREGWMPTASGDRLKLPEAACDKLHERTVGAVYVSTQCAPKTEAIPPCGDWSSVPRGKTQGSGTDGAAAKLPAPTLITSLLPDGSSAVPCCPLMSDADKLYACICASKTNVTLFAVEPNLQGRTTVAGQLNPPNTRNGLSFPATVYDRALYWAADRDIQRTPLGGNTAIGTTFDVKGAIYDTTSLLADAAGVYVLASGVTGAQGAPVQLLKIANSGEVTPFDTRGNRPVYQFDQDDAALYVATASDESSGTKTQRSSSVLRIAKADGATSNVLREQTLTIEDLHHGGYIGVQVQAPSVYALFEQAPSADATVGVQLQRVDAGGSSSSAPTTLYTRTIDPRLTQIGLFGVVDGTVILTLIEFDAKDGGSSVVRGSSLLAVAAEGGAPRILADFARDFPVQGIATDANQIYWLNNSGRLYGLPRTALR